MECMVRDVSIFYEDIGSGHVLLLLHDLPLDHRHIANDMEPVFANRRGWRRLYPDLPGMGKTKASGSITNQDQMLELVIEFINLVVPGKRFVVAGTSYGAYLARGLVYYLGSRIDSLLLNVPLIETDKTELQLPRHWWYMKTLPFSPRWNLVNRTCAISS